MTKKDYIQFAEAIKKVTNFANCKTEAEVTLAKKDMAFIVGSVLEADNYNFSWDKWEAYIFNK